MPTLTYFTLFFRTCSKCANEDGCHSNVAYCSMLQPYTYTLLIRDQCNVYSLYTKFTNLHVHHLIIVCNFQENSEGTFLVMTCWKIFRYKLFNAVSALVKNDKRFKTKWTPSATRMRHRKNGKVFTDYHKVQIYTKVSQLRRSESWRTIWRKRIIS